MPYPREVPWKALAARKRAAARRHEQQADTFRREADAIEAAGNYTMGAADDANDAEVPA